MRKYYIDNIRIICILLLFPYHTFMIYNSWGESFYVYSRPVVGLSLFNVMVFPWWMTLLFTLAGVSSAYALRTRTAREYVKERVAKLLIPLLCGILLIIPAQSYLADVYHNDYSGGYLEHYKVFFTRYTDLTGYDGGFTPGHTWFMLYLFILSMIALPLMLWYNKREKKIAGSKITMPMLIPMFLVIIIMTPLVEISGKSIGESLACFLLGYFVLSHEEVQEKLMKYRNSLGVIWAIFILIHSTLFLMGLSNNLVGDIEQRMLTWSGILAIMGLGRRYLNFNNGTTRYFTRAAFPIYLFHQSVLVIVAFFTLKCTNLIPLQVIIIISTSFIFTVISYEIFRRFQVTCYMFGIKKYQKQETQIRS